MKIMDNIKYIYILSSNNDDFYLEQAFLSITTLKMKMPKAFISLLTDNKTIDTITINPNRQILLELLDEYKVITFSDEYDKKYRSRWLKTSMRKHISGNFLYIDSDTIITDKLNIKSNFDISAVLDIHIPIKKRFKNINYKDTHTQSDQYLGFSTSLINYYNSGVIFSLDTQLSHEFFNTWHSLWLYCVEKSISDDQPSFNMANYKMNNIINEINGTWNCQLVRNGLFYLPNSNIIHFYNAANDRKRYIFAKLSIYKEIAKIGNIPLWQNKLLKHPKAAFYLINRKDYNSLINKIFITFLIIIFSHPINYLFMFISLLKRKLDNL